MDTNKVSYDAGVAKGKTEEKTKTLFEKAGDGAETAKKTLTEAGQSVQASAVGAVDAVKGATGMKK